MFIKLSSINQCPDKPTAPLSRVCSHTHILQAFVPLATSSHLPRFIAYTACRLHARVIRAVTIIHNKSSNRPPKSPENPAIVLCPDINAPCGMAHVNIPIHAKRQQMKHPAVDRHRFFACLCRKDVHPLFHGVKVPFPA